MNTKGSLVAGLALSLACQLFIVLVLLLWMAIAKDVIAYFLLIVAGALQWVLVLPLVLRLRSRGKLATLKGVLIMSVLGMLVNVIVLTQIAGRNANSTGPLF